MHWPKRRSSWFLVEFLESYIPSNLSKALPAEMQAVLSDVGMRPATASALPQGSPARSLLRRIVLFKLLVFCRLAFQLFENFCIAARCHGYSTFIPNACCMKAIDSSLVMQCLRGILLFFRGLLLIRKPGLVRVTATSKPMMPMDASYSTPGTSIYSGIPKEKLPK